MIDGPLSEVAQGRELLRLIERHVPGALPKRCGEYEPPRERFDWDRLDRLWRPGGFVWRSSGRPIAAEGYVMHPPPGDRVGYVTIDADPGQVAPERMVALAEAVCAPFRVIYGHVHLITEADRGRSGPEDPFVNDDEPYLFFAAHEIADVLPTLFWATVLGPPLVERLGRKRVLATPAARISEPAERTVLIQLTDRAETLVEDYAAFDAARQAAKRHLGKDAFYGGGPPVADEDVREQHQGDARTAADLLRNLTEYAVESLLEDGLIAPFGVAMPADGQVQTIGAPEFPDDEAAQVITEHIRAFADGRMVVLAALCSEDTSRHTKVPDERRVIRIRLEARGESPFMYFQPVTISDDGARLEEIWTEPADPTLLADA